MRRTALYTLIIIFSIIAGSYMNYLSNDLSVLSILFRSAAIILFPTIISIIISGIYQLEKNRLSSSFFDKILTFSG